jgi:hypothetical protein
LQQPKAEDPVTTGGDPKAEGRPAEGAYDQV